MPCCGKTVENVKHIATGWTNLARGKTNDQIKEKLRICRNCGSNRWKGMRNWCGECGCYIPALVRSKKPCKLGKFERIK